MRDFNFPACGASHQAEERSYAVRWCRTFVHKGYTTVINECTGEVNLTQTGEEHKNTRSAGPQLGIGNGIGMDGNVCQGDLG